MSKNVYIKKVDEFFKHDKYVSLVKNYKIMEFTVDLVIGTDVFIDFPKGTPKEVIQKISEALKGNTFWLGKHHSDESRKKISASMKGKLKGRTLTDDVKKKLSVLKLGEKNPFFGKHHSEETRKKMSESRRGKKRGPYKKKIK